jgi:hypothetical protein
MIFHNLAYYDPSRGANAETGLYLYNDSSAASASAAAASALPFSTSAGMVLQGVPIGSPLYPAAHNPLLLLLQASQEQHLQPQPTSLHPSLTQGGIVGQPPRAYGSSAYAAPTRQEQAMFSAGQCPYPSPQQSLHQQAQHLERQLRQQQIHHHQQQQYQQQQDNHHHELQQQQQQQLQQLQRLQHDQMHQRQQLIQQQYDQQLALQQYHQEQQPQHQEQRSQHQEQQQQLQQQYATMPASFPRSMLQTGPLTTAGPQQAGDGIAAFGGQAAAASQEAASATWPGQLGLGVLSATVGTAPSSQNMAMSGIPPDAVMRGGVHAPRPIVQPPHAQAFAVRPLQPILPPSWPFAVAPNRNPGL